MKLRAAALFLAFALAPAVAGCRSGNAPAPPPPLDAPPSASPVPPIATTPVATVTAVSTLGMKGPGDAGAPPVEAAEDAGPSRAASASRGAAPEDMLLVAGGTFTMGADKGGEEDERPAHAVTVAPFWLDKTEVTQAAYEACVAAKVCRAADAGILATFDGLFKGPHKPIVGISWHDARAYCEWKGKRLPREAEFERAVRGDDGRRFPWGNDAPTHERTVFSTNAPEEVGTHPTGRGPYGHDDLAGNVWEWLEDDYDPLAYSRPGAPEGKPGTCAEITAAQDKLRAANKQGYTGSNPIPSGCDKSIRGGAYNYPAGGLRSTNRIHHPPSYRLRMTGVRCAKDAG
jgi:formylglycine-generating enzyme required for sulfatase activity